MHKYILFAGDTKRPNGGYDDYVGSSDSIYSLKKLAVSCNVDGYKQLPTWADIVDVTTMGRLWTLRDGNWIESDTVPSSNIDSETTDDETPTKLYKYYGGFGKDNQNLVAITDAQLWYQNPTKFNDPFDSNPAAVAETLEKTRLSIPTNYEVYIDSEGGYTLICRIC